MVIISNKYHFAFYFYAACFLSLAVIFAELSRMEKSITENKITLSNFGNFLVQLFHLCFVLIPVSIPILGLTFYNENFIARIHCHTELVNKVFWGLLFYVYCLSIFLVFERFITFKLVELYFWVWSLAVLLLFIIYSKAFGFQLISGFSNYSFMSNVWVISIICNIISKRTVWDSLWLMIAKAFLIGITPYSYLKVNSLGSGFWRSEIIEFLALQSVLICILYFQTTHGSRFFLPDKYRSKIYESYVRNMATTDTDLSRLWDFWMMSLCEPELKQDCGSLEEPRPRYEYYQTEWGHVFHSACFHNKVKQVLLCPKWEENVPENNWDD